MLTNIQTTYILLEKGIEDVALHQELLDVKRNCGLSYKDFIRRYPALYEVMDGLNNEIQENE